MKLLAFISKLLKGKTRIYFMLATYFYHEETWYFRRGNVAMTEAGGFFFFLLFSYCASEVSSSACYIHWWLNILRPARCIKKDSYGLVINSYLKLRCVWEVEQYSITLVLCAEYTGYVRKVRLEYIGPELNVYEQNVGTV